MKNRMFSREHLWLEAEGNLARVGITDYAQKELKSIMFLDLPDPGEMVTVGKRMGDIESIKTISDLISPVTGRVKEVNETVLDEPDMLNEKPYENWLVMVEFDQLTDGLMDEKAYMEYCEKE